MSDRDREILDMYFRNELSSQANLDYFNSRKEDSDFKELLEEEADIIKALKEQDASRMKSRMKSLESEMTKKKSINKYIILLLVLIVSSWLAWHLFAKDNNNTRDAALYAEFYTPYPNIIDPLTKGGGDDLSVFQKYEKGDYSAVLNELADKVNISEKESFYLAMTHLELENYDKASTILSRIKDETLANDIEWYQVLICLKLQKESCAKSLNDIAEDSQNPYIKKARLLQERLR